MQRTEGVKHRRTARAARTQRNSTSQLGPFPLLHQHHTQGNVTDRLPSHLARALRSQTSPPSPKQTVTEDAFTHRGVEREFGRPQSSPAECFRTQPAATPNALATNNHFWIFVRCSAESFEAARPTDRKFCLNEKRGEQSESLA